MLASDRLADTDRFHGPFIDSARKIVIDLTGFPELAHQHVERTFPKCFPVVNAQCMHLLCGDRPYSPKGFNGQTVYKGLGLCGMYRAKPVRFPVVGGNLGEELIIGYTGRGNQVQLFADASLDFAGDVYRQFYTFFIMGNVEKGFVQRDRFDKVGISMEDLMYLT